MRWFVVLPPNESMKANRCCMLAPGANRSVGVWLHVLFLLSASVAYFRRSATMRMPTKSIVRALLIAGVLSFGRSSSRRRNPAICFQMIQQRLGPRSKKSIKH